MEWSEVAAKVGQSAPLIGAMLGGPVGGAVAAVGSLVASAFGVASTPDAVNVALATNPDAALKLRELEAAHQEKLAGLALEQTRAILAASVQNAGDINRTMQAEAAADHWPTYTWRPFIGFMFGAYVASMWMLPLVGRAPVALSADLTLTIGAILGIASFYRGKMQADPAVKTDTRG